MADHIQKSFYLRRHHAPKKQNKYEEDTVRCIIQRLCESNGVDCLENIWKQNWEKLQTANIRSLEDLKEFLKVYPKCFNVHESKASDYNLYKWGKTWNDVNEDIESLVEEDSMDMLPLDDIKVEVTTELLLCEKNSKQNDQCKDKCGKLHLCKFFLLSGLCSFDPCHYTHDISSGHNYKILKGHFMDHLSVEKLRVLFTRRKARTSVTRPFLCRYYNKSSCGKGSNCPGLHICSDFISGLCVEKCGLNHDLTDIDVRRRLEQFAIKPEDLGDILQDNLPPSSSNAFTYVAPSIRKNKKHFPDTSHKVISRRKQESYRSMKGATASVNDSLSQSFEMACDSPPSNQDATHMTRAVTVDVQMVNRMKEKDGLRAPDGECDWGGPARDVPLAAATATLNEPPQIVSKSHQGFFYADTKRSGSCRHIGSPSQDQKKEESGVATRLLTLIDKLHSYSPPTPGLGSKSKNNLIMTASNVESDSKENCPSISKEQKVKDVSDGEITRSDGEVTDSHSEVDLQFRGREGCSVGHLDGSLQASRIGSFCEDGERGLSGEVRKSYMDDQEAVCKGQVCGKKTRARKFHGNASWDYKRRGKNFAMQDFKGRSLYEDKNDMAAGSQDTEKMKPHNFHSSLVLGDQHGKDFSCPNSLKKRKKSSTNLLFWRGTHKKNWFRRGKKRNHTLHKLNGGKENIKNSLPSQYFEMTEFKDEERHTDTATGPYVSYDHSVSISGRMMQRRELEAVNTSEIPSRSPSPRARHSHRATAQRRSPFPRRWRDNHGSPFSDYSREEWLGSDRQDSMEHERSDFTLGDGSDRSRDYSSVMDQWPQSEWEGEKEREAVNKRSGKRHTSRSSSDFHTSTEWRRGNQRGNEKWDNELDLGHHESSLRNSKASCQDAQTWDDCPPYSFHTSDDEACYVRASFQYKDKDRRNGNSCGWERNSPQSSIVNEMVSRLRRKSSRSRFLMTSDRGSNASFDQNRETSLEFPVESVEKEAGSGSFDNWRKSNDDTSAPLWHAQEAERNQKISSSGIEKVRSESSNTTWYDKKKFNRQANASKQYASYEEWCQAQDLRKNHRGGSFTEEPPLTAEEDAWDALESEKQTGGSKHEVFARHNFDEQIGNPSKRGKKFANYEEWKRTCRGEAETTFNGAEHTPGSLEKRDFRDREIRHSKTHNRGEEPECGQSQRETLSRIHSSVEDGSSEHSHLQSRAKDGNRNKRFKRNPKNGVHNNSVESNFADRQEHGHDDFNHEMAQGYTYSRHRKRGDIQSHRNWIDDHNRNDADESLEMPGKASISDSADSDVFWEQHSRFNNFEQNWNQYEQEDEDVQERSSTADFNNITGDDLRHRLKWKRAIEMDSEPFVEKKARILRKSSHAEENTEVAVYLR